MVSNISSVQSLSRVQLFVTPWTTAHQASLSITTSQSLLKLVSIESVMPSNHLILCCPLLLLPSILPSIKAFSNELPLRIRWPEYWSFSSSISPPEEGIHRPGPHLRPVHADHPRPPLQWALNSGFSVYGNDNRRIRPSRTGEPWRSHPGYSLPKRAHTLITPSSRQAINFPHLLECNLGLIDNWLIV